MAKTPCDIVVVLSDGNSYNVGRYHTETKGEADRLHKFLSNLVYPSGKVALRNVRVEKNARSTIP